MNPFIFCIAGLVVCCCLPRRDAGPLLIPRVVLCFSGVLLFWTVLTTAGVSGISAGGRDGDEGFRRAGSIRVLVHGASFNKRRLAFGGGEADDVFVAGAPPALAQINEDGRFTSTARFEGERLYAAFPWSKQDSWLSVLLHGPSPLPAYYPSSTWRLRAGSEFCIGSQAHGCSESSPLWRWAGRLEVRAPSAESFVPACDVAGTIRLFRGRAVLDKVPTAAAQIFPLATYGRELCSGRSIRQLEWGREAPFVYLHFLGDGTPLVSSFEFGRHEQLLVRSALPLQAVKSMALARNARVDLMRIDVAPPMNKPALEGFVFPRLVAEYGPSRFTPVAAFDVTQSEEGVGHPILVRPTVRAVQQFDSFFSCARDGEIAILGSGEETETARTAHVPFIRDLASVGAQSSVIRFERESEQRHRMVGCAGRTRAAFGASSVNGLVPVLPGGSTLALGDPELGKLYLTVSELAIPYEGLLLFLFAAGLARLSVLMLRPAKEVAVQRLVLLCVDVFLILRVVMALQEQAMFPDDKPAVWTALVVAALAPLALQLVPGATAFNRILRRLVAPERSWSRTLWLLVPVVHLAAVLLGVREKVGVFHVTALLVPLYTGAVATMAFGYLSARTSGGRWSAVAGAALIVLFGTAAFVIASDTGALIYFIGPALVIAVCVLLAPAHPKHGAWLVRCFAALFVALVPAVSYAVLLQLGGVPLASLTDTAFSPYHFAAASIGVVAACLAFFMVRRLSAVIMLLPGLAAFCLLSLAVIGSTDLRAQPCSSDEARLLAACLEKQTMSTNGLRVARTLFPDRMDAEFSREARGMSAVFDELEWMNGAAWAGSSGRGFMTIAGRSGLDRHDNALTMHLIAPFGRSAALLVLFVLLLTTAAGVHRWRSQPAPQLLLSTISISVMALVSGYVLLANLLVVPFTGRNVYLTDALSSSDLVEGLLLIAMALASALPAEPAK